MSAAPLPIPPLPAELLAHAQALAQPGRRTLLGIVAPPGAGKSTLASALCQALGAQAQLVPMDGFHLSNAELRRLQRHQRKGAPDTFDAAGYVNLLQRLRAQAPGDASPVYAPDFDRSLEESIAARIAVLPQTPLVITEGNYLLLQDGAWGQVGGLLDEVWYLDVDDAQRQERLLARHMEFGRSLLEAQHWVAQTDEPNARRIQATRHLAQRWVRWDRA